MAKVEMQVGYTIEIVTPKKVQLDGIWLGPKKAKRVIVWVHGLGSSLFRKMYLAERLLDSRTAVLMFNNRGHDKITSLSKTDGTRIKGGSVHEIFTDCIDDIEGAIKFAKSNGAKDVYLVGHSTGCQKSAYWGSKRGKGVRGIILLAPVSDYSAERMSSGISKLKRAEKVAREYMKKGKRDTMLPADVWGWPWIADAQRFLSLYSGSGAEEIFTYWKPERSSQTLRTVKVPTLAVLAEKDEYAERPAKEMAVWFGANIAMGKTILIPHAGHGFQGAEMKVAAAVRAFMKDVS